MKLRQPRLAEMVASILRDQILSGHLQDGDDLPRQEDLLKQFEVSKPSLREALRILEAEGLITVRRGNQGGAVVHVPGPSNAAYMIGLVLQFRDVAYSDVGSALKLIEPVCAGLAAARDDRLKTVLPPLRAVHEASKDAIDDAEEFTRLSRQFHEQIVAACGNETLILVVGALESLWSGQWREWATQATSQGKFPGASGRQEGIRAHERLLSLIEKGDVAQTERAARKHLEVSHLYTTKETFGRRVEPHSAGQSSPVRPSSGSPSRRGRADLTGHER